MRPRSFTLSLFALAFVALLAHAQQYRWVDEHGRVQYTDTAPPPSARDVQKKNFNGNAVAAQTGYALARAMREAPVTLYTHPICKEQCQLARDVLSKRGVPFTEVVVTDTEKAEQLKKVSGGTAVPVLVVGTNVETTISADAYNRALDAAGYPSAGIGSASGTPQATQ